MRPSISGVIDVTQMFPQRFATKARPLSHLLRTTAPIARRPQRRWLSQEETDDPDMVWPDSISSVDRYTWVFSPAPETYPLMPSPSQNGGYINPPAIPRQFRDPYADWWDKQERRNYGEPVHEDNDILGVFSPEEYTHFTPGWGLVCIGTFVATVFSLMGVVSIYYPDKPSVHRGFEGGLDRELGGERTVLVSLGLGISYICTQRQNRN